MPIQRPQVLAIIPARGGSKGIPRKNIRLLGGTPLVVLALNAARASERIDRVVVSTDDNEIAQIVIDAGGEVVPRPTELATDTAATLPVLQHAVEYMADRGWRADVVVLLEPTSPFRTPAIINECVTKLDDPSVRSAATVTQLERNPFNIFSVEGDRAHRFIIEPKQVYTRRQQFAHLKRINGCVYVYRAADVREGRLLEKPLRVVEMSAADSINIDTPVDFKLAEILAGQQSV